MKTPIKLTAEQWQILKMSTYAYKYELIIGIKAAIAKKNEKAVGEMRYELAKVNAILKKFNA